MIRHARKHWAMLLTSAVVLALTAGPAPAQEPLTWSQDVPADSVPITLYADTITTWREDGKRIFLLKGQVLLEHGVVTVHVAQGVAWLDEVRKQRTGIYHLELYGDGEMRLQEGLESSTGPKGHVELTTRGELRIRAYRDKVVQAPLPADPVYLRAIAMKYNLAAQANTPPPPVCPPSLSPSADARPSLPSAPIPAASTSAQPTYLPPPSPGAPNRPPARGPQIITLPAVATPAAGAATAPRASLGFPD